MFFSGGKGMADIMSLANAMSGAVGPLASTTAALPADTALTPQQQAFLEQISGMGLITDEVVERARLCDYDEAITQAIEADAAEAGAEEAMIADGEAKKGVHADEDGPSPELPVDQDAVAELLQRFTAIQELGPQWGAGSNLGKLF
jgi:hypothetical protein